MEKVKRSDEIRNEVLERIEERRTLLNHLLRRKANWIGDISVLFRKFGPANKQHTYQSSGKNTDQTRKNF